MVDSPGSRSWHGAALRALLASGVALAACSVSTPATGTASAAIRAACDAPASAGQASATTGRATATGPATTTDPATVNDRVAGLGPASSIPAAVIRVDQAGYPAGARKLADIMTVERHPASLHWMVLRRQDCKVVDSGTATVSLGSWSTSYPGVWQANFSQVRAPGSYRIALSGSTAVSPWFQIGPAASLYQRPLANALSFYRNERDGPNFIRSPLRTAPGHLNDAHAMTFRTPPMTGDGIFKGSLGPYATGVSINSDGGWFDAGDYLKFSETTSYTVAAMLQGIVSFPNVLGTGGQANFRSEAKFGLDFLQRLWNPRTRTLYYQVGIGEANDTYAGDHDIWRQPQADDHFGGSQARFRYIRHPPVLRAGAPGARISPNLAGRLAADFALCFRVFRLTDRGYAAQCLRSAETIYSLAGTNWHGNLLTVAPHDFYPETTWRDDMMLGATELSLALHAAGPSGLPSGLPVRSAATYLHQAANWAHAWVNGGNATADTLNLYDVSGLAYYELSQAIRLEHGQGLAVGRSRLLTALHAQLQHAMKIAAADPFRYGFAWDQYDTAAHGVGLSVLANEYDALTGKPAMAGWAQRWLDGVLGANAWGVSLVVGDGTVFPHCLQHQIANLVGSPNGKPPVLAGATVEGPNSFAASGTVPNMKACTARAPGGFHFSAFNGHQAVFADNVQSYSTVEPAIDLTALTPMAFAWQEVVGHTPAPAP